MEKICWVCLILVAMLLAVFQLAQDIETPETGVVMIRAQVAGKSKTGTGFIVHLSSDEADIVTASHVVEGDSKPQVEFYTRRNRSVAAKVVGQEGGDPSGLAVLAVSGKENLPPGLSALPLATAVSLKGGDEVTLIGFPRMAGPWAVIKGNIVSPRGREIVFSGAIDEGNSGGPMLREGHVVGLVTGLAAPYGRATPAASVQLFLEGSGLDLKTKARGGDALQPETTYVEKRDLEKELRWIIEGTGTTSWKRPQYRNTKGYLMNTYLDEERKLTKLDGCNLYLHFSNHYLVEADNGLGEPSGWDGESDIAVDMSRATARLMKCCANSNSPSAPRGLVQPLYPIGSSVINIFGVPGFKPITAEESVVSKRTGDKHQRSVMFESLNLYYPTPEAAAEAFNVLTKAFRLCGLAQ